ncbi:MAG: bifunctional serine/threonine-protein kinase/formylglycine-generating enzyme family protein [Kofleriaceae bacterium]
MFCPSCRSVYPADWKRCPTDEAVLLTSDTVGKYRIESVIGVGGMGAVYRASNPDTQADVALKLMHAAAAADSSARARFQREAAAIAALRTRHAVGVLDFGTEPDGTMYLVMELLVGHTLRAEIHPPPMAMPLDRVRLAFDGALRGLGAAHRAGIVHRDLKPENIFLAETDDGEVAKVLDFGIARTQTPETGLTQSGALMGTPAYMAPEQVAGDRGDIGPWTDVYAVGVILYEALTGHAVFSAKSVSEVLTMILVREFQPLRELRADLPDGVYAVVERALAPEASARFADADAMRDALLAALPRAGTVSAPPVRLASDAGGGVGTAPTLSSPTPRPTPQVTPRVSITPPEVAPPPPPRSRRGLVVGSVVAVAALGAAGLRCAPPRPRDRAGATRRHPGRGGPARRRGARRPALGSTPHARRHVVHARRRLRARPGAGDAPNHDALPAQRATLEAFAIDLRELTLGEPRDALRDDRVGGVAGDGPEAPARNVTAAEALAACAALGKRLPTELEWEAAARRTPQRPSAAALRTGERDGPAPPGSTEGDCTPQGLCDMLGNVAEWTSTQTAAGRQIIRGASYAVAPTAGWYATIHARVEARITTHDPEIGVRCALTIPTEPPASP